MMPPPLPCNSHISKEKSFPFITSANTRLNHLLLAAMTAQLISCYVGFSPPLYLLSGWAPLYHRSSCRIVPPLIIPSSAKLEAPLSRRMAAECRAWQQQQQVGRAEKARLPSMWLLSFISSQAEGRARSAFACSSPLLLQSGSWKHCTGVLHTC